MIYLQDNWEDLANAIIISAVKDYVNAYRCILRRPDSECAQEEVKKLERFFFGEWYAKLTDLDPDYLLDRLKEEIENDRLELFGQEGCNHQSAEGL